MNLVAYDNIDSITNKNKTWIDVYHKCMFSREIAPRNYICFGKKYNSEENTTVIYIITLDDKPSDRVCSNTIVTNNGCIKISIKSIWDEAKLYNVKAKYINAIIKHIEHTDDGDIYEFNPIY